MGVPLIAGGKVSVRHGGSLNHRQFTSDDIELLQLAADRAATTVHSLMTRDERIAATA